MQTAMDRFDKAMRQLRAAQVAEEPLWLAIEAAGADSLARLWKDGEITIA
jgi:hypothetical protein